MPALILVNQATRPAGVAGKARSDGVVAQLVTCTNNTVEGSYLWTLVDAPIRSALVRGTTGAAASFTFTPDVKGTYTVSLRVNGSVADADNDSTYLAIRTTGGKTLSWRYQAAGETTEDNEDFAGLGFPSNTNIRGWATNEDLIFEEVEESTWETQNALTTFGGAVERLVKTDAATGKISPTLITGALPAGPAGGDLSGTYPNPTVARLQGRNVSAAPPADTNVLKWNSGTNQWEPGLGGGTFTPSEPNGITGTTLQTALEQVDARTVNINDQLHNAFFDDFTTFTSNAWYVNTGGAPASAISQVSNLKGLGYAGSGWLSMYVADSTVDLTLVSRAGLVLDSTLPVILETRMNVTDSSFVLDNTETTWAFGLLGPALDTLGLYCSDGVAELVASSGTPVSVGVTLPTLAAGESWRFRLIITPTNISLYGAVDDGASTLLGTLAHTSDPMTWFVHASNSGSGLLGDRILGLDFMSWNGPRYADETPADFGTFTPMRSLDTYLNLVETSLQDTDFTWSGINTPRMVLTGPATYGVIQDKTDGVFAPGPTTDSSVGFAVGSFWWDTVGGNAYTCLDATPAAAVWKAISISGTGDVVGPASATDHAVARWDLTTGKLLQDSSLIVIDGGQVQAVDGLVGTPTYSFTSDIDTGMYRDGTNNISFATGGTKVAQFFNDTTTGGIQVGDGDIAQPSFGFLNDIDTGFYLPSVATGAAVATGVEAFRWVGGQLQLVNGTAANPSIGFSSAFSTGLYLSGGNMAVSVGGTLRWFFQASQLRASGGVQIAQDTANSTLGIYGQITTTTLGASLRFANGTTGLTAFTGNSGQQRGIDIDYTLNQTATASFSGIRMNLTQTAVGSGDQYFQEYQIAGTTVAGITSGTNAGRVLASFGTSAAPAIGWIGRAGGFYSISTLSTGLTMDLGATSGIAFTRLSGSNYVIEHIGAAGSIGLRTGVVNSSISLSGRIVSNATPNLTINNVSVFTGSAVAQVGTLIDYSLTQTATAGFTHLLLAQTQTSLGSGAQRFVSGTVGGTERFAITSDATMPGQVLAAGGSAARPGYAFLSYPTTGLYSAAGTDIRLAFGGIQYSLFQAGSFSTAQNSTNFSFQHNGVRGRWTVDSRMDNAADTNTGISLTQSQAFIGASITQTHVAITETINQTGTSSFTQLLLAQTQTALGSGAQRFVSATIAGTERFAVTSDTTMPGQVLAADGSNARPTYSFVTYPTLGMSVFSGGNGVTFGNDTDRYLETYLDETKVYGDLIPNADNARSLGAVASRWSDVFAVQTTIGDLNMRDPYPEGKSVDEIAHWKLIEGLDGIHAYNIRTGKKYEFPLLEVPMDEKDLEILRKARERYES